MRDRRKPDASHTTRRDSTGPATVGGEILYSACYPCQAYGVRTIGSQGVRLPLPMDSEGLASISPDGKQVATAGSASEDGSVLGWLQIAEANGSHKRVIWKYQGGAEEIPAWNKAGTEIALTVVPNTSRDGSVFPGAVQGGLWVVPVKGGRPHRIAPAAYGSVAWSPNGAWLVYTTSSATSPVRIRTISAKGGPYRQVATISADSQHASVYTSVAWSPNGKRILIDSYQRPPGPAPLGPLGHSQVQQVSSTGSALQTLLPDNPLAYYTGARYSPDGKRIALVTIAIPPPGTATTLPYVPDYSWTLNTLNVNGSHLQAVASLPRNAQMLGWFNTLK